MATDYNKILLDKGYTQAQIDAMRWVAASWGSQQDIVKAWQTQTTTTSNTATQTSWMNSMSQSVAQNNSRNAQVGTGDVVWIQQSQTKSTPITTPWATWTPISQDTVAQSWDSLSAIQQKNALSRNKALNDYITSRWLTVKKEETPVTTTKSTPKQTTAQTPKQQQWDYQDNSQARMDEMARNLNWFRQTNPELFQDESMFYNFFIDWKGRSQDQIDYLWNYFNNVKKFWKYDNMPASALWDGLANWTIPQDYLDYVKAQDPQKYQEILSYKQDSEDRIKYESYLDDLTSMAWYDSEESKVNVYPDAVTYAREMGYFVDEDWNWVDDNLYVQPTDEERQDVDRINTINARRMEIKNMQKNLLDDLVEQYPWVPKATLMGIVQDRTKDISREYDDLWVELVQLQGTVDYLQNERSMQSEARQKTIQNLDNAYWMYYQYSPWGIAELAQSKYAATNITLDQADSGNETQKQMALQNVLDWYYEKYWDIIQRSEQQVINDVIAYAKKNWIWLAQALQENFVQPLQSKPEFATLSSWKSITSTPTDKWAKLSDNMLYNTVTWEIRDVNGDVISQWTYAAPWTKVTNASWKSYTVVTEEQLITWLDSFLADKNIWDVWWECWAFVNNWLKAVWAISENIYDNSKESKLNSKNEDVDTTAQTGWVAIRNPDKLSWNWAKYWHVWFVIQDNWDWTVKVLDSNWTKNAKWEYDKTIGVRDVPKSSLYGYFNPTKWTWTWAWADDDWDLFSAKVLSWIPTQLRNTDVEKKWYLDIAEKQKEKWLSSFETAMSIMWFDIRNKSDEAQATKQKILDVTMSQWDEIVFNSAVLSSMAEAINSWNYEKALTTLENQMWKFISKENGGQLSRDNVSDAMKAVNDLNNIKYYQWWGEWGINTLAEVLWWEWKKTAEFNVRVGNVKSVLKWLWYDDDDIDNIVPKLTNNKSTFTSRVDALEDAILWRYNTLRWNHSLPPVDTDALLWKKPLYDIYKVYYTSVDPYELSKRDYNIRKSISSENEAFASI